jgi:hypothetical protein
LLGKLDQNSLSSTIKKPILGLKEGKVDLVELLVSSGLDIDENSFIRRTLIPSKANPEIMVDKVELDFE